jgi:hypothetical protein
MEEVKRAEWKRIAKKLISEMNTREIEYVKEFKRCPPLLQSAIIWAVKEYGGNNNMTTEEKYQAKIIEIQRERERLLHELSGIKQWLSRRGIKTREKTGKITPELTTMLDNIQKEQKNSLKESPILNKIRV